MNRLRERSRAEGRSVNEVAVDALARGLGDESPNSAVRVLGTLLARPATLLPPPATAAYEPSQMRKARQELGLRRGDLSLDLDWIREPE